ncbi:probable serine/threonine-protein kinase pkgA [Rana temporaria]|uniref:probable serine/threonine-protein kinase pkgA n=1 Tax=Rana temporaria TaxID=8407 RepID=UPI001AADC6EC|nr:probable serine/threonine-protein kinase pkgA [Rana temporaria]
MESFIFYKIIGEGGYGKVLLATHRDTGTLVAVKMVKKSDLLNDPIFIRTESEVLQVVGSNHFCTRTYATFQIEDYVCYVMEYLSGGTLEQSRTKEKKKLSTIRVLSAELICGVQSLHSMGVVHRDLKPDQILIDGAGHVKIADFGLSATNMFGSKTDTEKVGTPPYEAPEMTWQRPYDATVDYFSLGVILYEFAFCKYPYTNDMGRFSLETHYPDDADPELVDFLNKLLCKDQNERKAGVSNIRQHRFFNGINWEEVEAGEGRPPFHVPRSGMRNLTRKEKELKYLPRPGLSILPKEQRQFNGISFVCDEWKTILKKNCKMVGGSTKKKRKVVGGSTKKKRKEVGESGKKRKEVGDSGKKKRKEVGKSGKTKRKEVGESGKTKRKEVGESGKRKRKEVGESGKTKRKEVGESGKTKRKEVGESCKTKRKEVGESCKRRKVCQVRGGKRKVCQV